MEHTLTVYRASAGSGKTFTLATEYIKLLISNPLNYRNILAVTFTNKATEEMKMRILSQLYGIWKLLPDSRSYIDKITNELEVSEQIASKRAGIALNYLMHNYNYFRVETIDTFFQSVLRNLARELDLNTNLRIMLNDKQIEQQAVDEMIEELESGSKVLNWIIDYINENISDDKGWNVIRQIKKFGENIFKDCYKNNSKELQKVLSKKDFFKDYIAKLHDIKEKSKCNIVRYAEKFFDELDKNGLSIDDFLSGRSGVCGYFIKLRDGKFDDDKLIGKRVEAAMEDPQNWVSKSNKKSGDSVLQLVNNCLFGLLNDCEQTRATQARLYKSADITLKHLNQLRLLNNIEAKIREKNNDTNQFLLSDTQTLLNKLIDGNDAPFIFEKIGTQLEHVMIDEFQDTSTVQWSNFKILLQECMSRQNSENMLVGDVKQSIYRWRSGDWQLLNNIENEFNNNGDVVDIKNLDTNYRSNGNIIRFNNAFFKVAADLEYNNQSGENSYGAEQLKRAYSDVEQQIPVGVEQDGLIKIELLPKENYDDETMKRVLDTVDGLMANNVPVSKIAILVRTNDSIQQIADYFMQERPNIKLVSNEAFSLDASQAVNMIIDALRFLTHPEDLIAKANLIKNYRELIVKDYNTDNLLQAENDIIKLLPKAYVNNRKQLLALPLFDLVEQICHIFKINELADQSAYICMFYDQLDSYLTNNIIDIDSFIEEWHETIHSKSIQSDEIEGIKLLTIHKSKGLEFDNVIIPFCDWKLEKIEPIWCVPNEEPFDELPIVPIDFSAKQMLNTIYEKDYLNEHLQNCVDNLNLLYVAFTRAGKNLFVFGRRDSQSYRSFLIEKSLDTIAQHLYDCNINGLGAYKSENITFEYGTLSVKSNKNSIKSTKNVFNQSVTTYNLMIKTFDNHVEFRQSNKSKEFIRNSDTDDKKNDYINLGNVLHYVFSTIHTVTDVDKALTLLEADGILYNDNMDKNKLQAMLRERLSNDKVAYWFSDKWQLFNERTILSVNHDTDKIVEYRPDRVMMFEDEVIVVDFKFGKPKEEYHNQVRNYMKLLDEMGYINIKGYLWFVYTNIIEEVK